MMSHEWLEQSQWNLQQLAPTDDLVDFGGQRSKPPQAVDAAKGVHVDAGRRRQSSKFLKC